MSLTIFHEGFTGELGLGAYNAISGFIPEILDKGR
jgi:hypothetical protein